MTRFNRNPKKKSKKNVTVHSRIQGGDGPEKPRRRKKKLKWADVKTRIKSTALYLRDITVVWGSRAFLLLIPVLIGLIYLLHDLPGIGSLETIKKTPAITVTTIDHQVLGGVGDIYGEYVMFKHLPKPLIKAVLATEDRNFFHHPGVDIFGLARAMVANVRAGKIVQGGSTITQQVAKNIFLTPDRTIKRKFQEMILAFWLEGKYSKEEILAIYVNRVYLGAGNFGIDAASRRYFNKPAIEMNLAESAIIAGLLKAPSRFAPTSNPALAQKRAEQVLLNMVDAELLKPEQVTDAKNDLMQLITKQEKQASNSQYFIDWVVDQVPEFVGNIGEDLVVTSTLDPGYQAFAEQAVTKLMDEQGEELKASQAALVSMGSGGAVYAMVGGRAYNKSQFNRAVQSKRQPGSAFKTFVYLTGLEMGLRPDSMVMDEPVTIGNWQPQNYDGQYHGLITAREAFAKSINSVAVQIADQVGPANVVTMAQRLGVRSPLNPDPSIALGTNEVTLLELTGAYAHIAAGGKIVIPYGIESIHTVSGMELYKRESTPGGVVLRPSIVAMMSDFMRAVVNGGTGGRANIGRPVAGKTGTTQDYRDAWFIGFTPQITTGVWVGNDNYTPMKKVTGGSLPASIWHDFMIEAMKTLPTRDISTLAPEQDSPLPWQTDGSMQPEPEQNIELQPSFWDKLMGN